jgi:hypothetical protein
MPAGSAVDAPRTSARNKRLLVLLAAIALAPIVLSYLAYYVWPRDARVNYGELLTGAAPPVHGTRDGGAPFALTDMRGRWVVLQTGSGECTADCAQLLYASRQARTIQNAERERVVRVWLVSGAAAPAARLLAEHPDLIVVRIAAPPPLPRGAGRIYLVDPLGNFVLAWPSKPDIKAMARDLGRLLRASSIG